MTVFKFIDGDLFKGGKSDRGIPPQIDSLQALFDYSLSRSPTLSLDEHKEASLVASQLALKGGDISAAQSHLSDALAGSFVMPASSHFRERCLFWQSVVSYHTGDVSDASRLLVSLLSRADLPLYLQSNAGVFLAALIPFLPADLASLESLKLIMAPKVVAAPRVPRAGVTVEATSLLSKSTVVQKNLEISSVESTPTQITTAQAAFSLCYFARLAEVLDHPLPVESSAPSTPTRDRRQTQDATSETKMLKADLCQSNLTVLYEFGTENSMCFIDRLPDCEGARILKFLANNGDRRAQLGISRDISAEFISFSDFNKDSAMHLIDERNKIGSDKVGHSLQLWGGTWKFLFSEFGGCLILKNESILCPSLIVRSRLSKIDFLLSKSEQEQAAAEIAELLEICYLNKLRQSLAAVLLRVAIYKFQGGFNSGNGILDKIRDEIDRFGTLSDRALFHRVHALYCERENVLFELREAAIFSDKIGDLKLLKMTCEAITRAGGSVFYSEIANRIDQISKTLKSPEDLPPLLLGSNPPGGSLKVVTTPIKKSNRTSRISAGGFPMLSPWKPSMADVSP